jgi:hypothetical protein
MMMTGEEILDAGVQVMAQPLRKIRPFICCRGGEKR